MIDPLWTLLDTNGWYHDAIDLVRDLLDVLDLTDPSPECQAEELTLRTTLARALMAVHGYNLEVEQAFRRALELATEVGDEDVKIPVLRALASYYLQTGDAEKSLAIGEELLKTGLEQNNEGIEIEGHSVIGNALLYVNVDESLAHLSQVIDRYDPGKHRTVRYRLGPDIGVVARISTGMMLWETGRLDSAVKSAESALQLAKEIDHPYSLAWALYHAGFLALNGGRFTDCLAIARRLTEISAEQGYVLWQTLATVLEGASRTALGNHEEGITLTEKGIDLYKGLAPPPIFWPLVLTLRANVYAMARNLKRAIELINEAAAIWEAGGATPPEVWLRKADLVRLAHGDAEPEVEALYERAFVEASKLSLHLTGLKAAARLVALRRQLSLLADTADLERLLDNVTEGADDLEIAFARSLLIR